MIEQAIQIAFERHFSRAPRNLAEAVRYSLFLPGKRIRARILFSTAELVGLDSEVALSAAAALEMIHCFTLIHDDLPCLDNDDMRRRKPASHKVHGEGLALLAGDALSVAAFRTLMDGAGRVESKGLERAMTRFLDLVGPEGL